MMIDVDERIANHDIQRSPLLHCPWLQNYLNHSYNYYAR